jgi:hypothetical protein
LIFIPAKHRYCSCANNATPANPNPNPLTPQQQWEALSAFIEGNEYVREKVVLSVMEIV